ncbi:MAG: hypothetical protein HQ402_01445 [Parcubacteria group bacterium]|nr:hypothetical protein [Parcubacteria group bacterium]
MEDKELLEKILNLSEENNKMLHKMKRSMRVTQFVRIIYWIIIIGSAIGAYYYVQPYMDQLLKIYSGMNGGIGSFLK